MIRLRALNQDLILEEQSAIGEYDTVEIEFLGHDNSGEVWAIFNNKMRHKVEGNKIVIPKEYLKDKNISIKLITKVDGYMRSYSIDSLPLKRYLFVGDSIDTLYPEKIKHLEARIKALESNIIETIKEYLSR